MRSLDAEWHLMTPPRQLLQSADPRPVRPSILGGFWLTVEVALATIAGRRGDRPRARHRAGDALEAGRYRHHVFVDIFRTLPQLVVIVFLYFGLPYADIQLSPFAATMLALGAVLAAFATEIFWAAIQAVPQGQWDAARSLGLGFLRILFLVILPQAIRIAVPLLTNRAIAITKGTALGTAVVLPELLGRAQSAMAIAANPSPLTLAAALYLLFFVPLVVASRWLEGLGPQGTEGGTEMEALQLFLDNFADWDSFVRIWPLLWQGLQLTVLLAVVTLPIAVAAGLLIAILYSFHNKALNVALLIWIDLFRSFPVLVLLILIFYGLPFLGLKLPSFAACVLALTLNNSGYYGEIFRAGIESIPPGQREAARALGLHPLQVIFLVILPQAIARVLAPLASNSLELVKTTSIAALVALPELLRSARVAQEQTYNPTPLTAAAIIFFVLLWPFARWVAKLERDMIMRQK